LTLTCPARQATDAAERVLASRTDQIQLSTVLSGDLAAAIRELKAKQAGELQVHGSGALTRWLLENDLVDEITLLIVNNAPLRPPGPWQVLTPSRSSDRVMGFLGRAMGSHRRRGTGIWRGSGGPGNALWVGHDLARPRVRSPPFVAPHLPERA
jgi:hypothetical protein